MPIRIALVCGEASGDALGAGLAQVLQQQAPGIELVGVTGPKMRAAGVRSWLDYSHFAVMGYAEVFKRLPQILWYRRTVKRALLHTQPQVFVGLDAPDLNCGLGIHVAKSGGQYVQYVCPSFWKWRPRRAQLLAKFCSKVLALLPFEVAHCHQAKIPVTFVGHRLADEITVDPERKIAARQQLGIATDAKVLALLPGSRVQELAMHEALFTKVGENCVQQMPNLEVWSAPLQGTPTARTCPGKARALLAAADAALVKSGTISLEAALLDCPQVVAFKVSGLSGLVIKVRLGTLAGFYSLPNLVANKPVVAEMLQERANVAELTQEVLKLFDAEVAATQRSHYAQIRTALTNDADKQAASAILELAGN